MSLDGTTNFRHRRLGHTEVNTMENNTPKNVSAAHPELQNVSTHHLIRAVKPFVERNNLYGFGAILTDYLIIAVCSIACSRLSLLRNLLISVPTYVVCAVIIASRFRGLENLVHEASHYNLFKTRHFNNSLEVLFATAVFRIVTDYRKKHRVHHKNLGDITADPDIQRYVRLGLHHLPKNYLWIMFVRPLIGFHTLEYITTDFVDFWCSARSKLTKCAFWTCALLLTALTDAWVWAGLYWGVPFFLILPLLRWWAEAGEHGGLDLNHEVASSRNNVGFWHRWLLHPHQDGYHAVHHVSPGIPWYRLVQANRKLMEDACFKQHCVESHSVVTTFKQLRERMKLRMSTVKHKSDTA